MYYKYTHISIKELALLFIDVYTRACTNTIINNGRLDSFLTESVVIIYVYKSNVSSSSS